MTRYSAEGGGSLIMVCLPDNIQPTRIRVDGDCMADGASEHKEVPNQMGEAQFPCAVKCYSSGVEDASREDQPIAGHRNAGDEVGEEKETEPTHRDIEGIRNPHAVVSSAEHEAKTDHGQPPFQNEKQNSTVRVERSERARSIGCRDQREDRHMIKDTCQFLRRSGNQPVIGGRCQKEDQEGNGENPLSKG